MPGGMGGMAGMGGMGGMGGMMWWLTAGQETWLVESDGVIMMDIKFGFYDKYFIWQDTVEDKTNSELFVNGQECRVSCERRLSDRLYWLMAWTEAGVLLYHWTFCVFIGFIFVNNFVLYVSNLFSFLISIWMLWTTFPWFVFWCIVYPAKI